MCLFLLSIIRKIHWKLFKRKKYAKKIKYWRDNPDKFCEEYLNIKLFNYQKEILKKMMNECTDNVHQTSV